MTYKEFKDQGYTIESVGNATVWGEVTIDETQEQHKCKYNHNQYEIEKHGTAFYRIISKEDEDKDIGIEFEKIEEVEDFIKNEM